MFCLFYKTLYTEISSTIYLFSLFKKIRVKRTYQQINRCMFTCMNIIIFYFFIVMTKFMILFYIFFIVDNIYLYIYILTNPCQLLLGMTYWLFADCNANNKCLIFFIKANFMVLVSTLIQPFKQGSPCPLSLYTKCVDGTHTEYDV